MFPRWVISIVLTLVSTVALFLSCAHKEPEPFQAEGRRQPVVQGEMIQNPLGELLSYLRLTEGDLAIELPKPSKDPFRLEKVNVLLKKPLAIEPYADYLSRKIEEDKVSLHAMLSLAIHELEIGSSPTPSSTTPSSSEIKRFSKLFSHFPEEVRDELSEFLSATSAAHAILNDAFSPLSQDEVTFLKNYFSEMMLSDKIALKEADHSLPPTSSRGEEQFVRETAFYLAHKIKRNDFYAAALALAAAVDRLAKNIHLLNNLNRSITRDPDVGGDLLACADTPFGKVMIGGKGPNTYRTTQALLIIDLGGDDQYHNVSPPPHQHSLATLPSIIIDLEGNDLYNSHINYTQGCGNFGVSFVVDCSGDDTYLAQDFAQGCGFFGVGILYDKEGNDRYLSDIMAQGAAAFGVGILCDLEGNDSYQGNLYNQGMGFVGGMGLLIEAQGNDSFFSGGKYPDFREPKVAFDSFSQGFGYGCRNFGSGGIGVLWDDQGNDHYSSSYFSQGASYWLALGLLIDNGGSDTYHARRYTQGAGTHLTVGALIDRAGDDCYTSLGVSQGCGYDHSQGVLIDYEGDDTYSAKWFAQGASGASGVGLLRDHRGNDTYFCGPFNSQGSGQYDTKTESGSIGLLLDLQGEDRYGEKGGNNALGQQGSYGGAIDTPTSLWDSNIPSWSDEQVTAGSTHEPYLLKPPLLVPREPLPELEANLENEEYRQKVINLLAEQGPSLIPRLVDYLKIRDDLLKLTIMEIVQKMGKDAAPELRKTLDSETLDASLMSSLLYMLGDCSDERAADTFLSFLKGNEAKLRAMAMRGVSRLKPVLPLGRLIPYAHDENPSVRKHLALTLKGYQEPAALQVLITLLADPHFNVRFAAASSLRSNGEEAKPYLLSLITHHDNYPGYAVNLARDLIKGVALEMK